jgi:hypothetical protein
MQGTAHYEASTSVNKLLGFDTWFFFSVTFYAVQKITVIGFKWRNFLVIEFGFRCVFSPEKPTAYGNG